MKLQFSVLLCIFGFALNSSADFRFRTNPLSCTGVLQTEPVQVDRYHISYGLAEGLIAFDLSASL